VPKKKPWLVNWKLRLERLWAMILDVPDGAWSGPEPFHPIIIDRRADGLRMVASSSGSHQGRRGTGPAH
jgi:hypothetical protein